MNEIWKEIKGYEGLYQVSNLGRIRNIRNEPYYIKKQYDNGCGYSMVMLNAPKRKHKSKTVHRIVALAFIENPNKYKEVNHIDCDKGNNRVDNLEWCTRKQNLDHAMKKGVLNVKKPVICEDGTFYNSISHVARMLNVTLGHLSSSITRGYRIKGKLYRKIEKSTVNMI